MKRLFTVWLLLVGLSGCISFTAQPGDKKNKEKPSVPPPVVGGVASAGNFSTAPSMASWAPHPEHQVNSPRIPVADPNASRMPYTSINPPRSVMAPTMAGSRPTTTTPAVIPTIPPPAPMPVASTLPAATPPVLPPPVVPPPAPTPAVPTGTAAAPAPMPTMPMVVTPRSEQPAERQVAFNPATPPGEGAIVQTANVEAVKPKTNLSLQPTPSVKGSMPAETKPVKGGAPLMRLVNTKRITLNFEVKDVGPSGLASVDLWYTQDCKEWKKYEAPTQAQAYVIEVDEEGMYGFTLLAKSGLGLGKEPPAAGDQPQVWVIVDLTKPDVQLSEVTPVTAGKTQQLTINWKASDKNLGRQPITLYYSDKEEGPWKVIASNLDNSGKYVWQTPAELARIFVRVEASDLAGNVGRAQSARPLLLDSSMPSVSIIAVESAPNK